LENKGLQFGQTIELFGNLLDKNTACTVQVALEAARSGNEVLTRAAEDLHRISGESASCLKQMSGELADLQTTWRDAGDALEKNLKILADGKNSVAETRASLEKVLQSLMQSKSIIEEIASAVNQQSASVEKIRQSQASIMNELINAKLLEARDFAEITNRARGFQREVEKGRAR